MNPDAGSALAALGPNGEVIANAQCQGLVIDHGTLYVLAAGGAFYHHPLSQPEAGLLGTQFEPDGATFTPEAPPFARSMRNGPSGTALVPSLASFSDGGLSSGPQRLWQMMLADSGAQELYPDAGFVQIGDVAYDPTHHRIFVADSGRRRPGPSASCRLD